MEEDQGWTIAPPVTCTQSIQYNGKLTTSGLITKKETEQENFFPNALCFVQTMKV